MISKCFISRPSRVGGELLGSYVETVLLVKEIL